jgi:hypothetical protein
MEVKLLTQLNKLNIKEMRSSFDRRALFRQSLVHRVAFNLISSEAAQKGI